MTVQLNTSVTKDKYSHVIICDVWNCTFRIAVKGQLSGETELARHQREECPMEPQKSYILPDVDEKGQNYSAPHVGKSIAEKLWDALDAYLGELSKVKSTKVDSSATMHQRDEKVAEIKGKCQGLAYGIHLMMFHYYPSVDDVTRQAVKRSQYKSGELEFEPTPGYQYNPPPASSKAYADYMNRMGTADAPKSSKPKTDTSVAVAIPALAPDVVNAIKVAYASQMLEPQALADAYDMSVEQLMTLIKS